MRQNPKNSQLTGPQRSQPGLTLAELVIGLALMGIIALSVGNFVIKSNIYAASMKMRFSIMADVQSLFFDIQQDLKQGASISNNSSDKRLEYTTYNTAGMAVRKIYQIITSGGTQYLALSTDDGTTWDTPYRGGSLYTTYLLQGTPKFLYAWSINNCTDFVPGGSNGVWRSGTDAAGAYVSGGCFQGTSSPVLTLPSQATKVVLHGFQFSTGKGNPEGTRTLPADLYMSTQTPLVQSTTTPASPAVRDTALVHAFVTNTANSLFGSNFALKGLTWDASRDQLILAGYNGTAPNTNLFVTDRRGIIINTGLGYSGATLVDGVAVQNNGNNILIWDNGAKKVYGLTLGSSSVSVNSTVNLSGLINSITGIAYDAGTPNDFYIVGKDPSTSIYQIYERNITTGALVGTAWSLPAAFDSGHPPSGLAIEPLSGNFILVRNYVNGSAPNKTIDIYIINRTNSSSTSFAVNVSELDSGITGTNGNWGIAYDPQTNRIFLSDTSSKTVYEVTPSQLISPRS